MKNFNLLSKMCSPAACWQSNVVRVRDGQQPTNLQLISNSSLTLTPFRLVKWVAVLCLLVTLGVGNAWGIVVKDTITLAGFGSKSDSKYVDSETTGATNKGIGAKMNHWNPTTGQIKMNGGGSTSATANSNYYVFNSSAMPGYITKVELIITAGTTTASYCRLGTSTSASITANVAWGSSTASTLSSSIHSWTLNESDKIKYFRINWAKNGGTVKASYVVITYVYHTVTYNGNGNTSGTVPADVTKYLYNADVDTKANSGSLAKTGFTFSGWNTKADGTGATFAVSTSKAFKITKDTTLYAKWVAAASCDDPAAPTNGSFFWTTLFEPVRPCVEP